jgi:hypothetical protein
VAERIRVTFDTDLRRGRLAVLFRIPLAIVPAIGLIVWTAVAAVALVVSWPVAVVQAEIPQRVHRLQLGYLLSVTRFVAWFALVGGTSLEARRLRHRRVTVFLRPLLALPAVVLASVLAVALAWTAFAAWFVSLARGRTTQGLLELGAFCIRYQAETLAYFLLLTPRYPALAPQTPQ